MFESKVLLRYDNGDDLAYLEQGVGGNPMGTTIRLFDGDGSIKYELEYEYGIQLSHLIKCGRSMINHYWWFDNGTSSGFIHKYNSKDEKWPSVHVYGKLAVNGCVAGTITDTNNWTYRAVYHDYNAIPGITFNGDVTLQGYDNCVKNIYAKQTTKLYKRRI